MRQMFCIGALFATAAQGLAEEPLIDYSKLTHHIALDVFRSGNHDEDGVGEYDIRLDYYTLVNTEADRTKEFNAREKVHEAGDHFGVFNGNRRGGNFGMPRVITQRSGVRRMETVGGD